MMTDFNGVAVIFEGHNLGIELAFDFLISAEYPKTTPE